MPTPPAFVPLLRNELAILFGFASLMLVCLGAYALAWKRYQKRALRYEADRRQRLAASPLYADVPEERDEEAKEEKKKVKMKNEGKEKERGEEGKEQEKRQQRQRQRQRQLGLV